MGGYEFVGFNTLETLETVSRTTVALVEKEEEGSI
jgi:hypothetical protein